MGGFEIAANRISSGSDTPRHRHGEQNNPGSPIAVARARAVSLGNSEANDVDVDGTRGRRGEMRPGLFCSRDDDEVYLIQTGTIFSRVRCADWANRQQSI